LPHSDPFPRRANGEIFGSQLLITTASSSTWRQTTAVVNQARPFSRRRCCQLLQTECDVRNLLFTIVVPCVNLTMPTSRFFPSASLVSSRFTFSSTCQPISLIIPALIIHHSFTLSLQAQNLPFQQILPTLDFFRLLDCLHIKGLDRTYHVHHFIISFTFYFFVYSVW